MCILIVPQQNTGFILDSDMEGKNEESYKFPIAVQQSFNSLWSQDVRGDPDSGIGGHWRSSDSGMYKFILILRALAVFRFRRALAVFRFRHAFTKNGIACIYLEGPLINDFFFEVKFFRKVDKLNMVERSHCMREARVTDDYSDSDDSRGGHRNQKGISEVSRMMTSLSHGCVRRKILSHLGFAAKTEHWAMPTWCHMFNSTLTGNARVWLDKLPKESVNSYEDLREAFRENYLQQKKHIKHPVDIHHIKQKDGECTEDFMERYKAESMDVEGAPKCMKISRFMHGGNGCGTPSQRKPRSTPALEVDWLTLRRKHNKIFQKAQPTKKTTDDQNWKTCLGSSLTWETNKISKRSTKTDRDQNGNKIGEEDGMEGPITIEAEIGGHFVHRISPSPHNEIIGRLRIRKIRAVLSTAHGMLKFPVEGGTVTLRSSRIIPMECAMIFGPSTQQPVISQVVEERIKVAIHLEYPEQTIAIGSTLMEKRRKELRALLRQKLDVFAWKPADMTGVPRHIAEHRLNIREGCPSVRKKKRGQAPERNKAIQEEVEKFIDAGIMKEVHYHNWLSNPNMDGYPLPEIDWKVESLCGYPFKCFLDAYKGYHQIKMAREDEEKTTFIMSQGIFCYLKMLFGLKNAGATYQRLVDKAFQKQNGRNLEVYVDDLVIKSRTEEEIIQDIAETFKTLREINMKLDPKKCTFRMREGMFLSYKVNADELKVCPDKADAVLSLPSPGCLKDVQKLNGKLASLNRFLSKSAERSLPFFKTLKMCTKKSDFQRTQEAEVAFRQMKKLISEFPMLTAPKEKEELIMYLAAAKEAISAVLMTERDGKQIQVYFMSCALRWPEINYTPMEKLVLALLSASRRLKRYFQAHTIIVVTDQPIKQLLSNSEITGRMLKWKFELEGYDIQYRPMISIKGQILADFIVEHGSGAGLILTNPEGIEFTYAMRFRFEATNNEAEYEALIAGLRIAEQMGVRNLQANVDSRLVANQVKGSYVAKESGMIQYLDKVKALTCNFKEFSIKQVSRSKNKKANALSKIASTSFAHISKQVLVEELKEKSIDEKEILAIVEEEGYTWMTPICEYLTEEILPEDKKKARAIRRKAS
ncbi:reverse transcriptase domain-containing protein [Tanacetum coccineum]